MLHKISWICTATDERISILIPEEEIDNLVPGLKIMESFGFVSDIFLDVKL